MLKSDTPVAELPTVTAAIASKLDKLGIKTVRDLLFYFPFRHDDLSRITPIALAAPGLQVTVRGRVEQIENRRGRWQHRLMTEAIVADEQGNRLKVVWFHQPYITKALPPGTEAFFSGKVIDTKYGLELVAPSYEPVKTVQTHTGRIVPIYSTTAGITSRHLRYLAHRALSSGVTVGDPVPPEVSKTSKLMLRSSALRARHFPQTWDELKLAERRFDFEELFILSLRNFSIRAKLKKEAAPAIPFDEQATKTFVASLPFPLTNAQRKAAWECIKDLEKPHPANRLINGDVGSGKTIVATIAAVNAARARYQTALLAPTEILAQQHHTTLTRILAATEVRVGLHTSSLPADLAALAAGRIQVIVGTHALLESKVRFHRLGLVIVDEQHRFGVEQRKRLHQKMFPPLNLPPAWQGGETRKISSPLPGKGEDEGGGSLLPHLISMTATPIPRTLALTLFGDLDLSIIDEMPPGRKRVETVVVGNSPPLEKGELEGVRRRDQTNSPQPSLFQREGVEDFIRSELKAGRQAFVVCPTIDPHDRLDVKSVKQEVERLSKDVFKDFSVGVLHGRMKATEKDAVMASFASGETNVLVATSVVEVGIDVPNATVMLIENADRFGLAALHQLRGRVGRGEHQSYCFLVPSDEISEAGRARITALATSNDGFALAEQDLNLRGPGDIFGVAQSGFEDAILPALKDPRLLAEAQSAAQNIFAKDPSLARYPYLQTAVTRALGEVHLE